MVTEQQKLLGVNTRINVIITRFAVWARRGLVQEYGSEFYCNDAFTITKQRAVFSMVIRIVNAYVVQLWLALWF